MIMIIPGRTEELKNKCFERLSEEKLRDVLCAYGVYAIISGKEKTERILLRSNNWMCSGDMALEDVYGEDLVVRLEIVNQIIRYEKESVDLG